MLVDFACLFAASKIFESMDDSFFILIQEKYSCNANVLVNCAGIFRLRLFIDLTEEEFDKIIRVNLKVYALISFSQGTSIS